MTSSAKIIEPISYEYDGTWRDSSNPWAEADCIEDKLDLVREKVNQIIERINNDKK